MEVATDIVAADLAKEERMVFYLSVITANSKVKFQKSKLQVKAQT